MKFDLIIGNPPYNDSSDSKTKKGGKVGMVPGLYKQFIAESKKWLRNNDSLVCFILPAGAFRSWTKNGYVINKARYNKLDVWGKSICTVNWYCSLKKQSNYNFNYSVMDKILKQDYTDLNKSVRENEGGLLPYNFYAEPYVITRTDWNLLSPKDRNPYTSGTFRLKDTQINKDNVIFLMKYLENYLRKHLFSMYSTTKKLKVEWLEGKTTLITEQDIINEYGLTPDDVLELKS